MRKLLTRSLENAAAVLMGLGAFFLVSVAAGYLMMVWCLIDGWLRGQR